MPRPIPRATIIGDGAMGTTCALILGDRGTEVTMWSVSAENAAAITRDGENKRFLPGHRLPARFKCVSDPAEAFANSPDIIISAVPCQHMRSVWRSLSGETPTGVPMVSVTKGIEIATLQPPTEILEEYLPTNPVACMSGPSIAAEVAAKKPAGVVVASSDTDLATYIQLGFATPYFRVYRCDDVGGVELAGAAKNVVALVAGLCDGVGAG